jgi:hypothetical protein
MILTLILGVFLLDIVKNDIDQSRVLNETALMKQFTFGDIVLKQKGIRDDILLNSNNQFEFLGTIHKSETDPNKGIAVPVLTDWSDETGMVTN